MRKGTTPDTHPDWVCLAVIGAPKGLRGAVRLSCYAEDPAAIGNYNPVHAEPGGRTLDLTVLEHPRRGHLVVAVNGVTDRQAAAALAGTRLFVPRSRMPDVPANEFYHHDLIGLAAFHVDGSPLGHVRAVHDWGAGNTMEISGEAPGSDFLVPFTESNVPVVDLERGRVIVDPPDGILVKQEG